jgi:hypothetical protein
MIPKGWRRIKKNEAIQVGDRWFLHSNGDKGYFAVIPEWAYQRWKRQANAAYQELSESEKFSDRNEADRFIALLGALPPSPVKGEAAV